MTVSLVYHLAIMRVVFNSSHKGMRWCVDECCLLLATLKEAAESVTS